MYSIYLLIFERHIDSIHRDTLWECIKEFKIPTELINICETCVQETRSAVRIAGTLSPFFENKTGLKQGGPLSPVLFNLAQGGPLSPVLFNLAQGGPLSPVLFNLAQGGPLSPALFNLAQGGPLSPLLFNLALQKVIQSIKMIPSGIKIGKEQLNVLAYADGIVLVERNEIEVRKTFCRNGEHCQKVRNADRPRKEKIRDSGKEKQFKEK